MSVLGAVGLGDWVTDSPEAYVERAVAAAADPAGLAALRSRLRERVRASPLTDAARFTRHLEAAYRRMLAP